MLDARFAHIFFSEQKKKQKKRKPSYLGAWRGCQGFQKKYYPVFFSAQWTVAVGSGVY